MSNNNMPPKDDAAELLAQRRADQGVYTLGTARRVAAGTEGIDLFVSPKTSITSKKRPSRARNALPISNRGTDRDALIAEALPADGGEDSTIITGRMPASTREYLEKLRGDVVRHSLANLSISNAEVEAIAAASVRTYTEGNGHDISLEGSRIHTANVQDTTHPALRGPGVNDMLR